MQRSRLQRIVTASLMILLSTTCGEEKVDLRSATEDHDGKQMTLDENASVINAISETESQDDHQFSAEKSSSSRSAIVRGPVNFVVLMMDDLDIATLELMIKPNNGLLTTPNPQNPKNVLLPYLAKLFDSSTKFNNSFVVDPVCCPSRATFLTGQYPHNHGVKNITGNDGTAGFDAMHVNGKANVETIASQLRSSDKKYKTGIAGKYLNGYKVQKVIPDGWDMWSVIYNSMHDQLAFFYPVMQRFGVGGRQNPYYPAVYQTQFIYNQTKGFIKQFIDSEQDVLKRNYFLYLTPTIPHVSALNNRSVTIPPGKTQSLTKKGYPAGGLPSEHWGCNPQVPNLKNIHPQWIQRVDMDENLVLPVEYGCSSNANKVRGCLRASDEFTPRFARFGAPSLNSGNYNKVTENGPEYITKQWTDMETCKDGSGANAKSNRDYMQRQHLDRMESMLAIDKMVRNLFYDENAILSLDNTIVIFTSDNGFIMGQNRIGNKMVPYEATIRVPLYIHVPGLPPRVVEHPVLNVDLSPTIADFAGLNPKGTNTRVYDGRSLRPLIEGKTQSLQWRKRFLVESWRPKWSYPQNGEMKLKNWYYVPDYNSLRTLSSDTNELYVRYADPKWHEVALEYQGTVRQDMMPEANPYANAGFIEYYNYNSTEGLLRRRNQANVLSDAQKVDRNRFIEGFKVCTGQACRDIEER
jgi:arylsulfatase A-like enzyme